MIKLACHEPIRERRKSRHLMPERTLHDMQTVHSKKEQKKTAKYIVILTYHRMFWKQQQWKLFVLCLARMENKSKTNLIN